MRIQRRRGQHGQVIVLFAIGLVAMIAMASLVVDGGNAYAQQRMTQNASDASAEAGAGILAQVLAGNTRTNQDVLDAINATAAGNDVTLANAVYTDIVGTPIPGGTLIGTPPLVTMAAAPPPAAWGVAVTGQRTFSTYMARIVGMDSFTALTDATAVTGYRTGPCSVQSGCVLLPVTVPINILSCDGSNDPVFQLPPTHWGKNIVYKIPLCKNGPGNVGWLDWTPPAGGTNELVDAIIPPPYNPTIPLPSWQYVTDTGNVNSAPVENALRTWDGQGVQFPIFDSTCDDTPLGPGVADCPVGHTGGHGTNQWYHIPEIAAFQFCGPGVSGCGTITHGAYVNGNNRAICDTGNGATSCLVGKFTDFQGEGTVGPVGPTSGGPSKILAVQLIR